MMQNRKTVAALVLLIVWMGVIFSFSATEASASSEQSEGIVAVIKSIAERVSPEFKKADVGFWDGVESVLRKLAHGFIYFVLGILCCNFIFRCGVKHKKSIASLICLLYAVSDEIHQLFVPGRSGQMSDVMIDFFGSICGVILFVVVFKHFFGRREA